MLAYLIERADALAAHAGNPRAEAELERVVTLIDAYEAERGQREGGGREGVSGNDEGRRRKAWTGPDRPMVEALKRAVEKEWAMIRGASASGSE